MKTGTKKKKKKKPCVLPDFWNLKRHQNWTERTGNEKLDTTKADLCKEVNIKKQSKTYNTNQ